MDAVIRSDYGDCAVLTLNRERQLNTINTAMVASLEQHLEVLSHDASRGVILTGAGKAFCVGTDLKEEHGDDIGQWLARIHVLLVRLKTFPKPIVAAINGMALGGGLELAAACLFRIASQDSQFGLPEIKLGLMPSYGGTVYITKLVGENRSNELMLSGESIDAETAKSIGLINHIIADNTQFIAQSLAYLQRFSSYSHVAFNAIRGGITASGTLDEAQALSHEMALAKQVGQSFDATEGITAFLEKRAPVWQDK